MKRNKYIVVILVFVFLSVMNGCKKGESVDSPNDLTDSPAPTTMITEAPTIALTTTPVLTQAELSMDAYENFLKNIEGVSFDRIMPVEASFERTDLFKKGSEYTLLEVLDIVTAYYLEYSTNKKIDFIDYSYIDCGKDGVKELVLRFHGMDIYSGDDDSTLVYIIKHIDGKLSLCYYYETWARSESVINEYGYYWSGGSNGASNHGYNYGLIDKDGNWQSIVYIEYETDLNQLTYVEGLEQIPVVAGTKELSGNIEIDTIRFIEKAADSDGAEHYEYYYTYYVYDDNWELIDDDNLYTDSIYKEIFDEAKVPIITPEEASKMILEKENKLGATDEILEGADITWKILDGSLFSDYVER